ncbi:MAG TPA: ATP-binding protein [Flavobacterium sp.]|nr:ATP-binding protein [Flavobacterium sp.]
MKKILSILAVMLCFGTARAQVIPSLDDDAPYIDSIVHAAKNAPTDSIRCLNSFKLSKLFLMAQNPEKAVRYLKEANALKGRSPFLNDAAAYYNAASFMMKGDAEGFEKALAEANEKLKKYNIPEAFRLRAIALQNYGIMLQRRNNEKGYMQLLVSEAIPIAKKSGDHELVSGLHKAIGIILMNTNEREKAARYLDLAEEHIEKASRKSPTHAESRMETYIIKAENLIEMEQFSNAKKILDKAFATLSRYPQSNLNDSYYYAEGIYYAKQKQLRQALESFEKGIRSATKNNNKIAVNRLKFAEYEVLYELGNYEKAKDNLLYLIENTPFIVDKKNYYNELAKVYSSTGDYKKAFLYADKYNMVSDSLNKTKFQNEIVALEAKYNKAENEKKIALLQSQNEKTALLAKNSRLNTMLLAGLSLLLLLAAAFLWKLNQNQKKLSLQKEINHKQALAALEGQQKLFISNALLEGEEAERKRIARDLHDGLGSMLSGLKMHFSALKDALPGGGEAEALLDNSIKELRSISQNLMPQALLRLGLESALKDLCLSLASPGHKIEFQYLAGDSRLPQHYEIAVYRIIQELLNNALKHAGASEILVACSKNQDTFFITVEDNGAGFDKAQANDFKGMGLRNLRNRIAFFGGKIEIDSQKGRGTAVYIEVKVKPSGNA